MKERMFSAGLSLKASLLLLGIFLVLAVAFHPPMAAAQMVSCGELSSECKNKCNSEFGSIEKHEKRIGCVLGCYWFMDLCKNHLGEVIKASIQEQMFLAEATLRVFEEAMER